MADLSLNPDGTMLAATLQRAQNFSGGLEILSVPASSSIRTVRAPPGTVGRFTPDGRSLIYGDREGRVWIYDTRTWKPRGRPAAASPAPSSPPISAPTAGCSPRRRSTATAALGPRFGPPIGGALPGGARRPGRGGVHSDGGTQLAVVHERGGYAWDLRPRSWTRHACASPDARSHASEWDNALPGRDYAPAC